MFKTLNNFELNSMEEFKDFMTTAMDGLEEVEILNLSVEDMIEIYNLNFSSAEDFALYYSRIKSEEGLSSYLEKNPITNKVDIKKEFKLTINDINNITLYDELVKLNYSRDEVVIIIDDIEEILTRYHNYKQAIKQGMLYNLALRYGKTTNLRIHSVINLYKMF